MYKYLERFAQMRGFKEALTDEIHNREEQKEEVAEDSAPKPEGKNLFRPLSDISNL